MPTSGSRTPASHPVLVCGNCAIYRRNVSANNASDNLAMTAAPPGPEASAWWGSDGGDHPTDEDPTSAAGFQLPAALVVCLDRDLQS